MVLVDHTLSPRIEFFCVLPRVAIIYVKGERQDFLSFLETVFFKFWWRVSSQSSGFNNQSYLHHPSKYWWLSISNWRRSWPPDSRNWRNRNRHKQDRNFWYPSQYVNRSWRVSVSQHVSFCNLYFFSNPDFSIRLFATVTTAQGALIIGGRGPGSHELPEYSPYATVACYNRSGWSRLDDLQSPRHQSRAIINGDKVYVIGGTGPQ